MCKNYNWYIDANLDDYAGKWIAIVDEEVVEIGHDAEQVYKQAREKFPHKHVSLSKVASDDTLILGVA